MPQFAYKAKKGPKETVEGILEAESRHAAITRLTSLNLFPLQIEERSKLEEPKSGPAAWKSLAIPLSRAARIRSGDVAIFLRQLADLLDAGLPLLRALEVLREQTKNRRMEDLLSDLIEEVRGGTAISQAMGKHPKVFDAVTVSMVHAGEVGGILNTVLARLADFSERQQETRAKIRSAMAYPLFLCLMGIVTIAVLMLFVIPKLLPVFEEMGQELPLPTRVLLFISFSCRDYWWVIAALILLALVSFGRRLKTPEGRASMDRTILKLPLLGPLAQKFQIARFARTLAALLANGVGVLHALKITNDGVGNVVLREELGKIFEEISKGRQLGECMKRSALFPPFAVNMVIVGEQGGLLEKALDKVADAYERDVDRAVKLATSLMEPAMILLMGSLVGFIVMAMLLPIFSINLAQ